MQNGNKRGLEKFCPFNEGMKTFLKNIAQDFWTDDLLLLFGEYSEVESLEILIGCIIFSKCKRVFVFHF